jgi:hypothetical protein
VDQRARICILLAPPEISIYHAVAAMRALFNASYGDSEIVFGAALLVVLAMVTMTLGARSFSRAAV